MQRANRLLYRLFVFMLLLPLLLAPPARAGAQGPNPGDPTVTPEASLEASTGTTPEPGGLGQSPVLPNALPEPDKAFSSGASYDSGWLSIAQGQSLLITHNLGVDANSLVVDMQFRNSGEEEINQRYYGGADFGASPAPGHAENDRVGAYWYSLTNTSVRVFRELEDTYAEQARVRIWVDSGPDYTSGWVSLAVNLSTTLTHNLGGSVDDLVVMLDFNSAANGINQRCYGGCDLGGKRTAAEVDDRMGAYWRTLTATQITVFRRAEDTYAEQVRVRIWVRPRATYDSGWTVINAGQAITFYHSIGGSPDDYQVVMDFDQGTSSDNGINQRAYGGMDAGLQPSPGLSENARAGVYWRTLTAASLVVYRRPEDIYTLSVRVRIFRYWKITPPDYDTGWRSIAANSAWILTHNLGGSAADYIVDFQYRSTDADGVNQRYYGGKDFGASPPFGHSADDRVGAYWRSLTNTTISIYRRQEDTYADQIRVRIWKAPKPDYTSGWVAKSPGEAASLLTHNLKGSADTDYLVIFDQYSSADGYNQRYFGGADFGAKPISGHAANDRVGAYWHGMTNTQVSLYRRPEDTYAELIRLRIWRVKRADYSSGWVPLTPNLAQTLTHNLGGQVDNYFVQMTQWDSTSPYTLNQCYYGGNDFGSSPPAGSAENDRAGSYWRSLDEQTITVYRRPEDLSADFVFVRIWTFNRVMLPVILR